MLDESSIHASRYLDAGIENVQEWDEYGSNSSFVSSLSYENGESSIVDVENDGGEDELRNVSSNASSVSINLDDLEYQNYSDDFRILIPFGWGLYEASLEGGHQRARSSSSSSSPNMLDLGFVEEYLDENDSVQGEDN